MHQECRKDVFNEENKCTTVKLLTYHEEDDLPTFSWIERARVIRVLTSPHIVIKEKKTELHKFVDYYKQAESIRENSSRDLGHLKKKHKKSTTPSRINTN